MLGKGKQPERQQAAPDEIELADLSNSTDIADCRPTPIPRITLTRPSMGDRAYSSHVYAVKPTPRELEAGIREPEQAHVRQESADRWPLESIVTVAPRRNNLLRPPPPTRGLSNLSVGSGLSVEEIRPPSQLLARAELRGPGTYRCTVTSVKDAFKCKGKGKCKVKARVKYQGKGKARAHEPPDTEKKVIFDLEKVDCFADKVATIEELKELVTEHPLPEVRRPEWMSKIRYAIFSVYRRLFAIILMLNLIAVCVMAVRRAQDPANMAFSDAIIAVAVNIFAASAMRSEHCINALFTIFLALPHSWSVRIRRRAAKIYSYGGVHSSCGISAIIWYIFYCVLVLIDFDGTGVNANAILTTFMLALFTVLATMSLPNIRAMFHDAWEISHRFAGWLAIAVIWAQLFVLSNASAREQSKGLGSVLVVTPAFWLLIATTCIIIYPWLRLRKRRIFVTPLSSHAALVHILHDKVMPAAMGIKISHSPLLENHSFATIPEPDGKSGYSCMISNAGDWTENFIQNPPKHVWIRGAPVMGVIRLALVFKRIVIVATGSGIGPCMSFLNVHPDHDVHIIWSARMPATSYGANVVESVLRADPKAIMCDTQKTKGKEHGCPDVTEIAHAVYKQSEAEAVVIISNPKVTREFVYTLEKRKVPTYGAIFDS